MPTQRRTVLHSLAASTLAFATGGGSQAQTAPWPNKPIRYIVPFAPGGTTDILARMFGEKLAIALGQPIVIENKPGQVGGSVGVAELARVAPDGYTIGGGTISSHAINLSLYAKLSRDPGDELCADHAVRHAAPCAAGPAQRARQERGRVHPVAQGQSGQIFVWLGGQWQLLNGCTPRLRAS